MIFGQFFGTESGIAVYPIKSDGSAGTPTAYLPINLGSANGGRTVVWDSTGRYLFASGADVIYELRFDSGANTVSLVDTVTVPGWSREAIEFLNGHLFAVSPSTQRLYVYNFANGLLTQASGGPVPLGFMPSSLAVLQH